MVSIVIRALIISLNFLFVLKLNNLNALFHCSHLAGGTWYRLTEEGVSGERLCFIVVHELFHIFDLIFLYIFLIYLIIKVPMDKYVVTEITPYLVVDAEHVPNPRPLDDEEDSEIVRGITAEELLQMIREGDFNLVGGWGALLALEKLRELGEI